MGLLNLLSTELRTYTTQYGKINVPFFHIDYNASEITNFFNNVNTADIFKLSALMSSSMDGATHFLSPLNVGESVELNSTNFFVKKTNSDTVAILRGNTTIASTSLAYSSTFWVYLYGVITKDNYVAVRLGTINYNSSSIEKISPCTESNWGYFNTVGEFSYSFDGIATAQGNTGLSLLNKPLYDGSTAYDSDPYSTGGSSGGGGGTGDFDGTSDTIGLPSLPSLSGLNTGFFTAFVPSASQMQSVSNYLWNNAITDILDTNTHLGEKVEALKKIVANPYDAIMGCSIIPVTPPTAGSKELKMYGILETGISLPYASTRWVQVDCGTLNIHEFWGSYLDYSPYTKTTSLYLPYIGTVSIDIDLIMAKSLQVVYYVDILSGICVAFILVDGSVKFHYQGQCSTQVPITNADYSSVISAGIGLIGNASQVVGSAVTGGVGGGVGGAVAGAVAGAISQAPSIASNVMSAKPDIRSGGAIGSSAGILSVQRPYLIIERPKQSVPAFQNHFTGYPSNVTAKVSDLTGYTEFETINLDGISLTDAEKTELDNILKGGVYL